MFELSYIILAIILLLLVTKFFSFSFKLVYNGLIGVVALWVINLFGSFFGITLAINVVNSLIAGFFGLPGVIFLIGYKYLF